MEIAPNPSRWRQRAHDRMLRLMEVFGRVLARRRVATADVTARLALAQRDPKSFLRQALRTCVRSLLWGEVRWAQARKMFTRHGHIILLLQILQVKELADAEVS